MKEFDNIYQALSLYPRCPICTGTFSFDHDEYDDWFIDANNFLRIRLHYNGEDIYITVDDDGNLTDFHGTYESSLLNNLVPLCGVQTVSCIGNFDIIDNCVVVKISSSCNSCDRYEYILALHIGIKPLRFEHIYLASEFAFFKDEKKIEHEIINNYRTKITTYILPNAEQSRQTQFPLISDSLSNPNEILNRIKKLLIFT